MTEYPHIVPGWERTWPRRVRCKNALVSCQNI